MTAVDPEGRIRHPLDVFHSTLNPDGSFVDAGFVPVADGLGQVEYLDPTSLAPPTIALDDLSDVTITSVATGDRLRWNGSAWVNTALVWRPVMVLDPTSGNYLPMTTGDGDAVMTEA